MDLQIKDAVLRQALHLRQWDCVRDLVKEGASPKTLSRAFRISVNLHKWDCARDIAKLDASQHKRNVVVQEDVRLCRWSCVTELIQLGVSTEREHQALTKAVDLNAWVVVPKMARYCRNPGVINFVLLEAMKRCQWTCIQSLVELGILSEKQKENICDEALSWGHFKCAVEILKQGISDSFIERIVRETLSWNQWHSLVNLLKEENVKEGLKLVVLESAVHLNKWDVFGVIVSHINLAKHELTEVINKMLLSSSKTGYRVFKQLCFRHTWSYQQARFMFKVLHSQGRVDMAFHLIITHGLWSIVLKIINNARISRRARRLAFLQAVRKGAWKYVKQILHKIFVKRADQQFAFLEAIRREQWSWALKLKTHAISDADLGIAVKACICLKQWEFVFRFCKLVSDTQTRHWLCAYTLYEAVNINRWECISVYCKQKRLGIVPEMIRDCKIENLMHCVLTTAVKHCQWGIIMDLLMLNSLNDALQAFVCYEAILQNQWGFAIELLKQGVSRTCSIIIVQEAFYSNQWHHITFLLEENAANVELKRTVVSVMLMRDCWDTLSSLIKFTDLSNQELYELMREAVVHGSYRILCTMVTESQKNRRIFKEICRKLSMPHESAPLLIHELLMNGQVELSLHVAATHGLWGTVRQLFSDGRVSRRARTFAVLSAMRQGSWKEVRNLSRMKGMETSICRLAFVKAVSIGQHRWAVKIYRERSVSSDDVKTAVKMCICQGKWEYVVSFCKLYSGALERLLFWVIGRAIQAGKWKYIRQILNTFYGKQRYSSKKSLWRLLLTELCILHNRETWGLFISSFNDFLDDQDDLDNAMEIFQDAVRRLEPTIASELAEWCTNDTYGNLGVLIAIYIKNWNLVSRLTEKIKELIATDGRVLEFSIARTIAKESWITVASLLKYAPFDDVDPNIFDELLYNGNFLSLLDALRGSGLKMWVVKLASWADHWETVEEEVNISDNQDLLTLAMRETLSKRNWNVLNKLLDRCHIDVTFFSNILRKALQCGETETVAKLLERLDPLSATQGSCTVLSYAVTAVKNVEEVVRLCVASGMSTHQCHVEKVDEKNGNTSTHIYLFTNSPMELALRYGQLQIAQILYESGACTYQALYRLRMSLPLNERLLMQNRHDLLQFIENVTSGPRTLKNLCRLVVSHIIGTHSGRRDRVQSLSVPKIVRDYILFKDIV